MPAIVAANRVEAGAKGWRRKQRKERRIQEPGRGAFGGLICLVPGGSNSDWADRGRAGAIGRQRTRKTRRLTKRDV